MVIGGGPDLQKGHPAGDRRKKLTTIKRADILAIINRVKDRGAGVSSNRTLAAIRKAFNWAVEEGHIEVNPAAGISRKTKEEARNRALSEARSGHSGPDWTMRP